MKQELIEEIAKESGLWKVFEEIGVVFPWPEIKEFAEQIHDAGYLDCLWEEE